MKQIKFVAFGILFGIAGFLIGAGICVNEYAPNVQKFNEQENGDVSLMIDTGDDLLGFSDVLLQDTDTVYSVLERLARENDVLLIDVIDYADLGVFINSINNKQSGDNNKYWQYWVNNEYADAAADKYVLRNGDVILWKFTSSRFTDY